MPRARAASEIIRIRALYSRKDSFIQTGGSTAVTRACKTAYLVRPVTVEPSWYDNNCVQYLTSCTDFRPSFAKFTRVFHNRAGSAGVGAYPAIDSSFIADPMTNGSVV